MNRQKSSGIALIWVLSGIVIVGIVALFIYGIVNRPPNRHIGDNKPWNEKMSQGSADDTETGAHAAFCAADQDKYWQYTHDIVPRIKSDYFDKGIGVKNVAVPKKIPALPLEYFLTSAKNVGMNESQFSDCMTKKPHQKEIDDNTQKALSLGVNGLPYMVINDYQTSGFVGGENGLRSILKAGGVE